MVTRSGCIAHTLSYEIQGAWKSSVDAVHFTDSRDLPVPPSAKSYSRNVDIICVTLLPTVITMGTQQGLASHSRYLMEMQSRTKLLSLFSLKRQEEKQIKSYAVIVAQ